MEACKVEAPRIVPPAHQEALEFCGMIADLVCKLRERAEAGDEDATFLLLGLRDELHQIVAEARAA